MNVIAVGDAFVLDFPVEHVRAHRKVPLSSADVLIKPVDGPVAVFLPRVHARRAHPFQGSWQVHSLVVVLHEGGNEGLKVWPARPLVVKSASGRMVSLGAQKAQGSHVAVEDVDGQQTTLETVQLQRRDVPVLLLVQARPVPEDEHLPVSDNEVAVPFLLPEMPGHVEIRQELANVVKQLVPWVGVLHAGPAVGEHDDERAVLRDAPRIDGLGWEFIARGQHEGSSDAHLLALLPQPGAPQEAHGRVLSAQHAQLGELLKIVEHLLVLRPRVVAATAATQDAPNTSGKSGGVKHLVLVGVPHS